MKLFKTLLLVTLVSPVASYAATTFQCEAQFDSNDSPYLNRIAVQGTFNMGAIKEAIATVDSIDYKDQAISEVGRALFLDRDEAYKPRKYVGYDRYDLSGLTNVSDFSKFYPGDTCQIDFLLPQNAETLTSFVAPVLVHCDQSGGLVKLQCTVNSKAK